MCVSAAAVVFEGDSNRKLLLQSLCGRSLHLLQLLWAGLLLSLEGLWLIAVNKRRLSIRKYVCFYNQSYWNDDRNTHTVLQRVEREELFSEVHPLSQTGCLSSLTLDVHIREITSLWRHTEPTLEKMSDLRVVWSWALSSYWLLVHLWTLLFDILTTVTSTNQSLIIWQRIRNARICLVC